MVTAGRVDVSGVSRSFGDVQALLEVSLAVEPGETVSLIGPSGCGKSTLLRLLAGLDRPGSGEVVVDGVEVTEPHHSRGFVFQDPTLFPWLTVRDNVMFGPRSRGAASASSHGRVRPARGAGGIRRRVPAPAVGRHGATRGAGARARQRAGGPATG